MRLRWLVPILATTACSSLLGIDDLTVAGGDASGDAAIEPGAICYGTLFAACFVPPSPGTLQLSGAFDTTTDARCKAITPPMGAEVCAVHASSISIANLVVSGSRPLVLIAIERIDVTGPIDAGSDGRARRGPGANPMASGACLAPQPGGNSGNRGGGGGAGATMAGVGGRGGNGDGSNPGLGANATGVTSIVGLRGGCAGSNGGVGEACLALGIGLGGNGGGALYLFAGTQISIMARVNASGAGGGAATANKCGGGGGGSGGMIALEATVIILDGAGEVSANGGGGGEGGAIGIAGAGTESTAWDVPAAGGAMPGDGGDGGAGATSAAVPGNGSAGAASEAGGGGGGGGLGVIRIQGPVSGASATRISPSPLTF